MEFIGIQAQQMVLQDETTALYMWRYVDDNMTLKMNGSPVDADWVELYSILYPRHDEKPFRVWGCNGHLVAQLATGQEVAVSWRVPLSSAGNPHNCSSSSWSGEAAEFVVVWRDPEPPENEP